MKIVIAGAGDVGTYLIERLYIEKHEIALIESDQYRIDLVSSKYDVAHIVGSCLAYDTLSNAGVAEADLYVAVTESEEMNLLSSILAKKMGVKKVIARIRHSKLKEHADVFDFDGLGIDELLSPDVLASEEIDMLLERKGFTDIVKFEKGSYYLVGLLVQPGDAFIGRSLEAVAENNKGGAFTPIAISRNKDTLSPSPENNCEENDHVYFFAREEGLVTLSHMTRTKDGSHRRVMILGGSRIGIESARTLIAKKYHVTIIERDRKSAEEMSGFLENALIVCGDSHEEGFLEENGIDDMDAFIAATGDSEANIISCLVAKEHGVSQTIALVKDSRYSHLPHMLGVDTLINKKMITADFISRHIKKGSVLSVASVPGVAIEIIEFAVTDTARIIGKTIEEIDAFAQEKIIIGGVIREGTMMVPDNKYRVVVGDKLVLACLGSCGALLDKLT